MNVLSQFCALTILLAIIGFYATKRKIQLKTGRNYMQLVIATVACVICDLLSIYFINRKEIMPDLVVDLVCKIYLVSLYLVTIFGLRYIFSDVFKNEKKYIIAEVMVGAWAAVGTAIIMLLPIAIHYTDGVPQYTEGPATIATYALVMITIFTIIFFLQRNKADLNYQRRHAVYFWMGLWTVSAVIQFFQKDLLIVSFGATLGTMVIYFALENPESNIDRLTGLFNENALLLFCEQKFNKKQDFALLRILLNSGAETSGAAIDTEILREVLKYLNTMPRGDIFRITGNDYTMAFDSDEEAQEALGLLYERMHYCWGSKRNVMLDSHFIFFPEVGKCKNVLEMQEIYNYAYVMARNSNKPFIVSEDVIEEMKAERDMEKLIKDAIENDKIEPFYQPIYNTATGKITSAEALARIRLEDGSYVGPNEFIPLAEKNGMIIALGEIVFEKVCRFIAREKPYERYGLEYIEVNLSTVQAGYEALADSFIGIMEREHVEAKYINLEITETASITDRDILLKNMKQLKLYGMTFSLDDFGSGQSNLNYVMDMPVDLVKFDREMTNKYFTKESAKKLMTDTIRMLKDMGFHIVSEGVEDEKMLKEMVSIGVDYIQGYYFSKPIPRREFVEYLAERAKLY